MELEQALRLTEILVSVAIFQRCLEHVRLEPLFFGAQLFLCMALGLSLFPLLALLLLWVFAVVQLHKFGGPYNGGADKMAMLILTCLVLEKLAPTPGLKDLAFGYLGIQAIFSYWISGWVKLRSRAWRRGEALSDVFAFSVYPVSDDLRRLANSKTLLVVLSWCVILFEVAFPLALLDHSLLWLALACAALFHLSNALILGLNRFLWIWPCTYPAILWLQARSFG